MLGQTILITGASTGIGKATGTLLARKGCRVFGTSRNPERYQFKEFDLLPLDVRSTESVENFIETVSSRTRRIDVLVNNAGYELFGAAEETSLDELAAQIDTNFTGAARVIQAVLPRMREQQSGKIINIGSLGGLVALPFTSAYSASKFALEGYSEALRYEAQQFGVFVSLIEAGYVKTESLDVSVREVEKSHPAYSEIRHRMFLQSKDNGLKKGIAPLLVAEAVLKIVRSRKPKLRYQVGSQAFMVSRLKNLLPQSLFESIVRGLIPQAVKGK